MAAATRLDPLDTINSGEAAAPTAEGDGAARVRTKVEVDDTETLAELQEELIEAKELNLSEAKILGQGAFGTVQLTYWRGTPIALKTSRDNIPEFQKKLFFRELHTMTRMRHPNIVQFLGYVDKPFSIALEYMPKGDLSSYYKKNRLSYRHKIRLCVDVLRALAYMHQRKPIAVIHRDVKPANIMMTMSGGAKLSDFGLARMTQAARQELSLRGGLVACMPGVDAQSSSQLDLTTPSFKRDSTKREDSTVSKEVGTKRYMAPEVPMGKYTAKVDIYSAGATFYELFEQSLFTPPTPSWALAPAAVRPVISSMCEADPSKRPEAAELIVSFEELLGGRPSMSSKYGSFDEVGAEAASSACACSIS